MVKLHNRVYEQLTLFFLLVVKFMVAREPREPFPRRNSCTTYSSWNTCCHVTTARPARLAPHPWLWRAPFWALLKVPNHVCVHPCSCPALVFQQSKTPPVASAAADKVALAASMMLLDLIMRWRNIISLPALLFMYFGGTSSSGPHFASFFFLHFRKGSDPGEDPGG